MECGTCEHGARTSNSIAMYTHINIVLYFRSYTLLHDHFTALTIHSFRMPCARFTSIRFTQMRCSKCKNHYYLMICLVINLAFCSILLFLLRFTSIIIIHSQFVQLKIICLMQAIFAKITLPLSLSLALCACRHSHMCESGSCVCVCM